MRLLVAALGLLFVLATSSDGAELQLPEGGSLVSSDLSLLPDAVRKSHDEMLAAALSGDIKELGKLFATQIAPVTVSFGGPEDPIAYLKEQSGDGDGVAILAILANILMSPYVAFDGGDGDYAYVWPSLAFDDNFADLTPAERVTAYRIMGRETFEESKGLDTWYYWRVGIGNDGEIQSFVAGD